MDTIITPLVNVLSHWRINTSSSQDISVGIYSAHNSYIVQLKNLNLSTYDWLFCLLQAPQQSKQLDFVALKGGKGHQAFDPFTSISLAVI